jgi:hypothetical protein
MTLIKSFVTVDGAHQFLATNGWTACGDPVTCRYWRRGADEGQLIFRAWRIDFYAR